MASLRLNVPCASDTELLEQQREIPLGTAFCRESTVSVSSLRIERSDGAHSACSRQLKALVNAEMPQLLSLLHRVAFYQAEIGSGYP